MKNSLLKLSCTYVITSLILMSCEKEKMVLPDITPCNLTTDYSTHPKHTTYQSIIEKYTKMGIVGLSVYIKQDNIVWQGASGMANIESSTPLQPCHYAYSASVGKTYCATAIMLLVESGQLKLDDKINTYLSADLCGKIANGNQATIKQLLNHTAGIPNVDDDPKFGTVLFNDPYNLNRETILSFIYDKKALNSPGEVYHYSSTGYELLTLIIDKVTGSHVDFYRKELLKANKLSNTFYKEPYSTLAPKLPNNYFERYGNGKIENISRVNFHLQDVLTGSDGIIATLSDYGTFLEKLLNNEIVTSDSLEEMKQFIPTDNSRTEGYGLGLRVRNSLYGPYMGHGGRSIGAGMDLYHFIDKNTTICLSTNLGTYVETDLVNQYQGPLFKEIIDAVFQ